MTTHQPVEREAWDRLIDSLRPDEPLVPGEGLGTVFSGLQRPECVLTHSSGNLFVSDRRGGVLKIHSDGSQALIGNQSVIGSSSLLPNGIAMQRDGGFLVANLGERGGVWRIAPDGNQIPWLTEVDGRTVHRVNFVLNDVQGRVWACISATDGSDAYPLRSATGYIVMRDAAGTRVVADGLHYTNECRVSVDGQFMYVNETFGRRLSRFRMGSTGELTGRETVAQFGERGLPGRAAANPHGRCRPGDGKAT